MDPPHLIKLTRNTLGDLGILIDGMGNPVKWEYIRHLHTLQKSEKLHLGNKITLEQIDYKKNKMKVRLATQVCSQSTGDSLIYCESVRKLPEFEGASSTAKFLKCMDVLFDTLNSRFTFGKYSKAPISVKNADKWSSTLDTCEHYIRGLKYVDGRSVVSGPRKAAFIGWLNDIKAIRSMYEQYVEKGNTICTS